MSDASKVTYQLFTNVRPTPVQRPLCLLNHLAQCTTSQFAQLSGLQAVPIRLSPQTDGLRPSLSICGMCQPQGRSSMCRMFAESIVGTLKRARSTVWRRCPYQKWCGLVPLRCDCAHDIACQVIGSSTISERSFAEQIALLDEMSALLILAEVTSITGKLDHNGHGTAWHAANGDGEAHSEGTHHHIWNAIAFVHEHLSETDLTVGSVAEAIGLNATYLAHMFSMLMGVHMRRFINVKRVELAKILLVRTDWQIKQVAFATGHESPQWFSHVFQVHAGTSPGKYRRAHSVTE